MKLEKKTTPSKSTSHGTTEVIHITMLKDGGSRPISGYNSDLVSDDGTNTNNDNSNACHRLLVAHTGGSQGVSPTSVVSKRRMVIQRMLSRPGVVRACWFHDRRKLDVADMACEVTSSSW